MGSKLDSAKMCKRWVTKEVLPAIRKTGTYNINHKVKDCLTFKIENEADLHKKTVSFIKKRYPNSIFTASLGENQDSIKKTNRRLI
jgi:prophage antirepressor-like protein